jgi:hypothetical protein
MHNNITQAAIIVTHPVSFWIAFVCCFEEEG